MARILLIDDEPVFYKMVEHALKPHGHALEYARTGLEGLRAVETFVPDVIIVDVRLPDLDGYEVVQRLRSTERYRHLPIIFLTSQMDISNKLKGFEAGADDYLGKPFQPEELVARVTLLLRRTEALRNALPAGTPKEDTSILTVHSLRGGVGCSSMAVNLALAYRNLWEKPTLLIDADINAGQISLMLNTTPVHTLEDLTNRADEEIDDDMIKKVITKHISGIDFIAAPPSPLADDFFSEGIWGVVLERVKPLYEFIVIDTSHNFTNISIHMLNAAGQIIMMLAPEMASIRAAINALEIYKKLGYSSSKVLPVLNQTMGVAGIKQAQIEKVLKLPLKYQVPYAGNEFIRAINFGEPVINANPESPAAEFFEDLAYETSKASLKAIPPVNPSAAWKRVTQRLVARKG